MPMILAGIVVACLIAGLSGIVLYSVRPTTYEAMPMSSVRIGDPGHNLVGPNWTGLNREQVRQTEGTR